MAYHYDIELDGTHYTPIGLVDSAAKVVWDKGDSGLNHRMRLDGAFIMYRSGNEALYDAIMNMSHCDNWFITAQDKNNYPVVTSTFNKRDLEYNQDKCSISIKPRYYDPNNIDGIAEEDYNIINDQLPIHTLTYSENFQFEKIVCVSNNAIPGGLTFDTTTGQWYDVGLGIEQWLIPRSKVFCGQGEYTDNRQYVGDEWSFFSQKNTYVGSDPEVEVLFNIETTWFREVKYVPSAVDLDPVNSPMTPPSAPTEYPFIYLEQVVINGTNYSKYVRRVADLEGVNNFGNLTLNNVNSIMWSLQNYHGSNVDNSSLRTLTRARRLNDILRHFAAEMNCTLSSQFFTSPVNPVSGRDLSNILVEQKSDCIFEEGVEPSDPATLGIITFKSLMEQLWAMFQVTWVIENNVLYIEHIVFFRFNLSYSPNYVPGLDLNVYYPIALAGTRSFTYRSDIPIREKFSFMEAWNTDFIGTDIHYTNCLLDGQTITYSAGLVTTDIDPIYLDNEASKDGFCFFHCDDYNRVISEVGYLSGITSQNSHLSWDNLHASYWRKNRPLLIGYVNNELIGLEYPRQNLKKQDPFEFPFCVENFGAIVNDPIATTLGNGEIESAEYSFKSGNIKIELTYE